MVLGGKDIESRIFGGYDFEGQMKCQGNELQERKDTEWLGCMKLATFPGERLPRKICDDKYLMVLAAISSESPPRKILMENIQ